jgi:hypothetical protein
VKWKVRQSCFGQQASLGSTCRLDEQTVEELDLADSGSDDSPMAAPGIDLKVAARGYAGVTWPEKDYVTAHLG